MPDPDFAVVSPQQNQSIREFISNRLNGKAMDKLKKETVSLLRSLEANGLAKPATVLNFNPIALVLDGGLAPYKVPSIIDEFVNDADRFKVSYKGREYKATVFTIRYPKAFPLIRDVHVKDGVEMGDYDARVCRQIEIAHAYLASYTAGDRNSSGMGGVVAFEGDRNLLKRDLTTLEVQVPTFTDLDNGWREYYTVPRKFSEVVAETLDMQRKYCNAETQRAQTFNENDGLRLNITDVHRIWHQYELDMGWRQKPAPWVTMSNEAQEVCAGCGEPKKRVEAYFCRCGRPFDPLKAYLAGELPVESHHLNRLSDKDWAQVEKEEARRLKRRRPESEQK